MNLVHRSMWLVLALALGTVVAGCHERPTVERSQPTVAGNRHPTGSARIAAPGKVEPLSGEVRVAGTDPGVIAELAVAEGQSVKKGDLLARIEDSQQRHAAEVAVADLHQAEAIAGGMASTAEEVRAAQADFEAATVRADQQTRTTHRAGKLGDAGVLSSAEVEQAVASNRIDDAAARSAEARLLLAKRGARPSERRLALARLEAAQARLAEARAALARREIRAPSDGVVLSSRYHPGEFYAPSQGPLLVIGNMQRLQVRLELDDIDVGGLMNGARCELRGDTGERLGEGTLVRVAMEYGSRSLPSERPTSRTDARVREAFVETDAVSSLAPGQRVWGYCPRGSLHASL